MSCDKVLCDLGVGINLMSYSLAMKLGIKTIVPTIMSLKFADRSIKYPKGVVKNVLSKVDKLIFPFEFVFLDMDDDCDAILILGSPFLAICRSFIDV